MQQDTNMWRVVLTKQQQHITQAVLLEYKALSGTGSAFKGHVNEKPRGRGGNGRRKSHRSRECTYRAEVEALQGRQSLDLK